MSGRSPSGRATHERSRVSPSPPTVSVPNAADFPDDRPIFEARPVLGRPWIWEVWDIEHPSKCGDYPVLRVDSKGAADDCHRDVALTCADALNARYAANANRQRRAEVGCQPVSVGDDGWSEWLHPTAPSFFSECCDCGLIHEMEFQIVPSHNNSRLNPGETENAVIIFRARRAASCDTHPKDGDVKQAPRVSGAVGEAETPNA